jgi:hypothetical protein
MMPGHSRHYKADYPKADQQHSQSYARSKNSRPTPEHNPGQSKTLHDDDWSNYPTKKGKDFIDFEP